MNPRTRRQIVRIPDKIRVSCLVHNDLKQWIMDTNYSPYSGPAELIQAAIAWNKKLGRVPNLSLNIPKPRTLGISASIEEDDHDYLLRLAKETGAKSVSLLLRSIVWDFFETECELM